MEGGECASERTRSVGGAVVLCVISMPLWEERQDGKTGGKLTTKDSLGRNAESPESTTFLTVSTACYTQ